MIRYFALYFALVTTAILLCWMLAGVLDMHSTEQCYKAFLSLPQHYSTTEASKLCHTTLPTQGDKNE